MGDVGWCVRCHWICCTRCLESPPRLAYAYKDRESHVRRCRSTRSCSWPPTRAEPTVSRSTEKRAPSRRSWRRAAGGIISSSRRDGRGNRSTCFVGCESSDRRWFERAVAAAEKGDVHGRVDAASLGVSLHEVGSCHASQGKFTEALPWFGRAVAAKENGDVHERVDSASFGKSLNQVGHCYASQCRFAEALPWFERARDLEASAKKQLPSRARSRHRAGRAWMRRSDLRPTARPRSAPGRR
jgi:hypothetical protein